MTEPDLKGTWEIRSSNSRFFPIGSTFDLTPSEPDGFKLEVSWEQQDKINLIDKNFRKLDSRTVKGTFPHPKATGEMFELVVTFCSVPWPNGKQRLFGLLSSGRIEGGGTGVWVAEGPPGGPPQE